MPYLILIIGLIIGAVALYMWFLNAETDKVKNAIRGVALAFYALILIFFAVTGRIIVSILLLVIAFPFLLAYIRDKKALDKDSDDQPDIKIIEGEEITEEEEKNKEKDNE